MEKVFENNPTLQQAWKTSDGQFFYTENSAKNHAGSLKDKTVTLVTRSDSEEKKTDSKTAEIQAVKKLNKEPLIAYAKEHFPEIEIAEEDNKETVLNKVLEAIEAKYATIEE